MNLIIQPKTAKGLPFPISLWLLISYRAREFKNILVFGGTRTGMWMISILAAGGIFIWLDYLFFSKLIQAILERLEFLAPYMLDQLIHTLFLSFFGLLILSSMTSSVSGFFMSREIPFLLTSPVHPGAFLMQRFGLVFTQSAWMIIIFGAPPFLAYSVKMGHGWTFLAGWLPVFLLLIIIPVFLGSSCGIVLMRLLPASRVNQGLSFLTLAVGAMIIILFRMSRPERLFMDVPQEEVMDFVQAMSVPDSAFMPTSWAASAVVGLGSGQMGDVYLLNLIYLLVACVGCALLTYVLFRFFYWKGLSSLDEGQIRKTRRTKSFIESGFERLPPYLGSYLIKDMLIFARDPARWTQLFLLGALVVLYIYNAYSFPLGGFFYRNMVAFLNLAITGFVLSALCVRFVFPSVSLEGLSMWITMSAPVPMRKFFLAKYIFAAVPLCLISLILSVTTNIVMRVDADMMILFGGAAVAMALALVGLNLGMGAVFPKFQYENEAQIPASPGGVVTMIISLAYIGFMIVFMAAPVYRFFASPMGLTALRRGDAVFGLAAAILLSLAVAVIPVGIGLKKIGRWSDF